MARRVSKIIAIAVLGGVIIYGTIGFFVLPLLARSLLIERLSQILDRDVSIQRIQINPFLLTCRIDRLAIRNRTEPIPLFVFDELFIDAELASLLAGGPVLKAFRLQAPQAHLVRYADRTYNVSDLLGKLVSHEDAAAGPSSSPTSPVRFSVSNIQITAGSVTFVDRPEQAEHHLTDLHLALPFISNLPEYVEAYVQPVFYASVNGTPVTFAGNTQPFSVSMTTGLGITIHGFNLPQYLAYLPAYRPAELGFHIASGVLDAELSVIFRQSADQPPAILLAGHAKLQDFSLADRQDRPLLTVPELVVGMDSADVFGKTVHLRRVRLDSPAVHVIRNKAGGLFPVGQAAAVKAVGTEAGGKPILLTIDEATVSDGTVTVLDEQAPQRFQTTLSSIMIAIRHFSTTPGQAALIEASLKTDAGETFKQNGRLILDPFMAEGSIELHRIALRRYAAYYRPFVDLTADGRVDVSADYVYSTAKGGTIKVSRLDGRLMGLELRQRGQRSPFLLMPALTVTGGEVDLMHHAVKVAEVRSAGGTVRIRRERDGGLDLAQLRPVAAPPASGSGAAGQAPASPRWRLSAGTVALDRYSLTVEDRVPPQPVTVVVSPLTITMQNFSTVPGARATVALQARTDAGSAVDLRGSVGIRPMAARLNVQVDGVQLAPLQPYWDDRLNVDVVSGTVSAQGTVTIQTGADDQLATSFAGEAALMDLATLGKASHQDLLKWSSLSLSGIQAGTRPTRLRIEQVALSDLFSRVVVTPDGTFNVLEALHRPGHEGSAEQAEPARAADGKEPWQARIDAVTLQGGHIEFADQFIQPSYAAKLTELGGKISNISSDEQVPADVSLHGKLDGTSALDVTGQVKPFTNPLFVDLKVDSRDIELNPMTPYAVKYVGYTIEKGQLSMSLKYRIAGGQLQAQNNIVLNQFTLGQKIESPQATTLPLRAAVSLLKDRNGQIKLDIPVSGALDDPQFSVWGAIGQVAKNLIAKAATAPFAVIGKLFGHGDDLQHVEFDYGKVDTKESSEDRLKALAKALYERPGLTLEIMPHVDPVKDREALRQQQFEEKLKAQKWKALSRKGEVALSLGSPEALTITPDEYADYLERAYRAETFPKPRNMLGLNKRLEVPEMEKLMLAHIDVTDEDLRELARGRGQHIKEVLVRAQVEPDRIVLVEPKEALPLSRVDFVIHP